MPVLDPAGETQKRDFDSALSQILRDLNHVFRRLRHYEDQNQWIQALRDGIGIAAERFAIFTIAGPTVRMRTAQALSVPEGLEFPLASARAFTAVIDGREPLTIMCTPAEVGPLASAGEIRAQLLPITNASRMVAIVFAGASALRHADILELVTNMASAVLERQSNQKKQLQILPISPPIDNGAKQTTWLPAWAVLEGGARLLHSKAQRFARIVVAQMELARPEACRAGREQKNFYLFLQAEIEKARDTYSKQYMKIPSMVDYLHLELIRAAGGDEHQLGAEYPGHLV